MPQKSVYTIIKDAGYPVTFKTATMSINNIGLLITIEYGDHTFTYSKTMTTPTYGLAAFIMIPR